MLDLAREWSTPPWQVEAEMSKVWWDRLRCLREERSAKAQHDAKQANASV